MKVFYQHGSKERLFEMVSKVNKITLTEASLPKEKKEEVIAEFIKYADKKLGLDGNLPKIVTSYDENEASSMHSFGKYTPDTNELRVVVANRNLADVLRTFAHEIIHHKQKLDGVLTPESSADGSEHENEANALAGVFMREFGKNNPIIFE